MEIGMDQSGSFNNLERWLKSAISTSPTSELDSVGKAGVSYLQAATPVDTGELASSWDYKVEKTENGYEISWFNNAHPETDANIVQLLRYGHGTSNGGYIPGNDFVTPAMKVVLDKGLNKYIKEVTSL